MCVCVCVCVCIKTLMLRKTEGSIEGTGEGMTEDEMVKWHHQREGCESAYALGVGDGTGKPGMLQSMGSQRVRHD